MVLHSRCTLDASQITSRVPLIGWLAPLFHIKSAEPPLYLERAPALYPLRLLVWLLLALCCHPHEADPKIMA